MSKSPTTKAQAAVEAGINLLHQMIKDLAKKYATEGYNRHIAAEASNLSRAASQVLSECRKNAAQEARLAELPPSVLIDYFRGLSTAERAAWLSDIAGMDSKGSVLS